MAVIIPIVPEGISDPTNLYNDMYQDLPDLRWDDVTFQDTLLWLAEEQPHTIDKWYATYNSSPATSALGQTNYTAKLPNGKTFEVDVRNVAYYPSSVLYTLSCVAGDPLETVPQYPGYDARNPKKGYPIGAPLKKQPWKDRVLYEDILPGQYEVGEVYVEADSDRYTKVSYQVSQNVYGTAWEQTFDS
jgi:hypothetical protein